MATRTLKHIHDARHKRIAILKVAVCMGAALLLALTLGLLLSGGDWTLPMDPASAASFTA